MDTIPDDVIEAMAKGMFGQDWTCGAPEMDGFRKALAAAEAKGYWLVPENPTRAMIRAVRKIPTGSALIAARYWEVMLSAAPKITP